MIDSTPRPDWYKDAVIYEVHVRAYCDANHDGIGDFKGLTSKLDYIQELGVNTIWLLPFYPSPGRDDGYDIADYRNIHPQYGTRADFRDFVREAHRRGLRVITELVINHTSDQHPWFQAARRAPASSRKRDFYVWSDSPDKYAGTRIIFTDTESSNWTWDPVAKAYFWHRFFSHQPDLNFDNPEVERAMMRHMRFWLDQGVDGLRLDAIPYLVEREGTSNENLPETHAVVKRIRKVVDEHYSNRLLLGEANMWPEDVRDYFGDGDECHMAYHVPLMPRMYMAIAQEDRHPIVEILNQTPDIPENCQWSIFLRNHDELTLEMVTNRERDYMYQMYAADPRARLNLGIRRRLAPLMENDLERIKLMNSLLLSMPGSPVIYYGDEIGMGDNFYLGDRNGVRTPMQWSPDRNAGFSRADPQQLFLPPIMDPIYGFEAVNVEAQTRDRSSLLNWMKRMLQIRQSTGAFGRGTLRLLRPGNRKVLAYVREYASDNILCVVNLSASAQPVELDLSEFRNAVPVELLGQTSFPPIGDLPYLLTLRGYGFYWFRLSEDAPAPAWHSEQLPREDLPVLVLFAGWDSFFPENLPTTRAALATKLKTLAETLVLPFFIADQRWYADKGSVITHAHLKDHGKWQTRSGEWLMTIFSAESQTTQTNYFLPLTVAFEDADEARWRRLQQAAIARVRQKAAVGVLADATADDLFCHSVVDAIEAGAELRMEHGTMRFTPTRSFAEISRGHATDLAVSPPPNQGSNTVVRIGDRLFFKVYRKLNPGLNPELEIGRFLTEVARFRHIVPLAGSVEYLANNGDSCTVALLQAFVLSQGDGWEHTVDHLLRSLQDRQLDDLPLEERHGAYLELVRMLGTRTAELHCALAHPTDDPAFSAEPITPVDLAAWRGRVQQDAGDTLELLATRSSGLPESARADAAELLKRSSALLDRITARSPAAMQGIRIRHHGDYHLGQVLVRRNDFVIVDFEGEPARPLAERRQKHSPLRDVAGMLRSFSYAAQAAHRRMVPAEAGDEQARLNLLLGEWEQATRDTFLRVYDGIARAGGLYESWDEARQLIALFEIEKALYEIRYELGNRPAWVSVPIHGLLSLTS
jgi:maltose alpha-D-glucosyltransferase/alpha-amylase